MKFELDRTGMYKRSFSLFCKDIVNQPIGKIHREIIGNLEDNTTDNFSIMVSRGFYKCLSADTELWLADGNKKKVVDLLGQEDIPIYSMNNNLKLELDYIEHVTYNDFVECYHLQLDDGSELTASHNHPVFTPRGWVNLEDLKKGDYVATPRTITSGVREDYTLAEAKVLGYFIGDGCISSNACDFCNNDKYVLIDFIEAATEVGATYYLKGNQVFCRGKLNNKHKYFKSFINNEIGYRVNSRTKSTPKNMFLQTNEIVSEYLKAYFTADGGVNEHTKTVFLVSVNKSLIQDVKALLLRYNIISNINTYTNRFGEHYILNISGIPNILQYYKCIGFTSVKQEALERIVNWGLYKKHNPNKDLVPLELINAKPNSKVKHISLNANYGISRDKTKRLYDLTKEHKYKLAAESDICWCKVETIESVGKQDTYNVQVKHNHNHITNGIISHNTWVFSRSYPLWLLYKADKPIHIIIQSMNQDMSRRILGLIRDVLITNEHFAHFKFKKETDKLLDIYIPGKEDDAENTHRIYSVPIGTRGLHGDLLILDDVMKDEAGISATNLSKVKRLFWNASSPMINARNGRMLFIGTPICYNDLFYDLYDLSEKGSGWQFHRYPAMYEDDDGKLHSSFPEVYPLEKLEEIKARTPSWSWEQEYMLNPVSGEDSMFPLSLINSAVDLPYKELAPEEEQYKEYFLGCDFAMSTSSTADYSAFCVVSKAPDRPIKIEYIWHERGVPESEQIAKIKEICRVYNISHGLVERKGITYSMGNKLVQDPELATILENWNPTNEEKQKILGNVNLLLQHKMLSIPSDVQHTDLLIKELQTFGIVNVDGTQRYRALSGHDDLVIGVALAVAASGGWVYDEGIEATITLV